MLTNVRLSAEVATAYQGGGLGGECARRCNVMLKHEWCTSFELTGLGYAFPNEGAQIQG